MGVFLFIDVYMIVKKNFFSVTFWVYIDIGFFSKKEKYEWKSYFTRMVC